MKPYLEGCGYEGELLRADYPFGNDERVPLAGFASIPADARSACVVAVDVMANPKDAVSRCRVIGAPIVLSCHEGRMQWWKQGGEAPEHIAELRPSQLAGFFRSHREDFSPDAVYRAKTWGRFDQQYQLSFVDLGLMPLVEREIGSALGDLIARKVSALKSLMGWRQLTHRQGGWLLKSVFWLVAAKILRDKRVAGFTNLDLGVVDDVFRRVGEHYGTKTPLKIEDARQRDALSETANSIERFSDLAATTTESLAYVYENTLISEETRSKLGTHSTPSYLVDYILGKLTPWIADTPVDARNVFEPACGHGAFLISAMRLLRESLPDGWGDQRRQRIYLRKRLHGLEADSFALEIALLSLTLADIPNPNGWDLQQGNMFVGDVLQRQAEAATILLANPPFEDFTPRERTVYGRLRYKNKTAEMLGRTLPALPVGASFGVVVPQTLLHGRNSSTLREEILRDFELLEVCKFPDNIFTFSDMESAVIIGRKVEASQRLGTLTYSVVRRHEAEQFRLDYRPSSRRRVEQSRFSSQDASDLRLPELEEVWLQCGRLPSLSTVARVGKGLEYRSGLPRDDPSTYSSRRFPGAKPGFVRVDTSLALHGLPTRFWMNLDPSAIRRPGTGMEIGTAQVLLNSAPVSHGPWRLKAVIDEAGHAVTSNFLTIRPRTGVSTLKYLWGLCNSPLANAYAYTHSAKRHNLPGMIRRLPIPLASQAEVQRITEFVGQYFRAVASDDTVKPAVAPEVARDLLLRVDAEVLRLYDLSPRIERQLLDLFAGWPRLGVPVSFDRYFPDGFEPCFPLHEFLSSSYAKSTAGHLRVQTDPKAPPEFLLALDEATSAFEE